MSIDEVLKEFKEGNTVIGKERVLKLLKNGEIESIFVSKNCLQETKDELARLAKLAEIEVKTLKMSSEEVGTALKKSFNVNIIGVLKGKIEKE